MPNWKFKGAFLFLGIIVFTTCLAYFYLDNSTKQPDDNSTNEMNGTLNGNNLEATATSINMEDSKENNKEERMIPILTTITTSLPKGSEGHSAVYDGQDSIYIFGGNFRDSVYKFNVSNDAIEKVSRMPLPIHNLYGGTFYQSAVWDVPNSRVLYLLDKDIIEYSPGKNESIKVSELPKNNPYSSTVAIKDKDKILIFGGEYDGQNIIEWSNNGSKLISEKLPFSVQSSAAVYYSNKNEESVFLFGGKLTNRRATVMIVKYDVKTQKSFTLNETLPMALTHHTAVTNGKYIYLFGGGILDFTNNGIIVFDPKTYKSNFHYIGNFPGRLRFTAAVYVKKTNRVYIFGGYNGNNRLDSIWTLNF